MLRCTSFAVQTAGKIQGLRPVGNPFSKQIYRCLSEFHLKKITSEFDHLYDTNKDGVVDRKDIDGFKQKLKKYQESVQMKAVKEPFKSSYDDYWHLLEHVCDADKDGHLTRGEWIDMWTNIIECAKDKSFQSLPQWVQLMPYNVFPIMDSKGDGLLDPEEYWRFWYHVGGYPRPSEARVEEIFSIMTEGGTHAMDLHHVQNLYADFYLSCDPASPGRFVCGPMDFS